MTTPLLEGFPPVVNNNADLLILGSFPSVQSLATHQYYGNPRNAFWPITAALFGFDASAPYETRLAALQSAGIAVWDVLHGCRRAGSSDAKFEMKSLVANDFGQLFATYPSITRVYFNGRAAERLFGRLVDVGGAIEYEQLPSTSPARAMPASQKLQAWRAIAPS
jgi:hypoxanthine-DNA glycosylase